jgi:chemotaxis protein CheD
MATITIGIADCRVSNQPDDALVTYALGSCIGVAVYDPTAKVAGLLHLMLPDSSLDPEKARNKPFMYADTGIPRLFHSAYALGADKKRMTVWLVGGAQVLDPASAFHIGKRNHLACRRILWAAGVMIHGEEVGGTVSRTVRLEVGAGKLAWNHGGGASRGIPMKGIYQGDIPMIGGLPCRCES